MSDKHLSTQFDNELSGISSRVLEMGGLVEAQVAQAVQALTAFDGEIAAQVLREEERVNQMEVEIDRDLSTIIARRQPTARDLRLLIAVSKAIANLERVGDEAARIARAVSRGGRHAGRTSSAPSSAIMSRSALTDEEYSSTRDSRTSGSSSRMIRSVTPWSLAKLSIRPTDACVFCLVESFRTRQEVEVSRRRWDTIPTTPIVASVDSPK